MKQNNSQLKSLQGTNSKPKSQEINMLDTEQKQHITVNKMSVERGIMKSDWMI